MQKQTSYVMMHLIQQAHGRLRRNLSGTPLRIYSRIYLVGRRLYSLIVSTLDVGGVSEDVVKKFMDSFKLS